MIQAFPKPTWTLAGSHEEMSTPRKCIYFDEVAAMLRLRYMFVASLREVDYYKLLEIDDFASMKDAHSIL